jgi:hypothetical protein
MERTEIFNREGVAEALNKSSRCLGAGARDNNVIDIDKHVDGDTILMKHEQRRVSLGGNKPELLEHITKPGVPSARRLFQTIDGLVELANIIGMSRIFKPWRLFHVSSFFQDPMQKSIADVELPHRPIARHSKGEHQAHRGMFNDWTESVEVVDAVALSKTLSHQPGLELVNRPIGFVLGLEHPPRANDVAARWGGHKCPGAIPKESGVLILHGLPPSGIRQCMTI